MNNRLSIELRILKGDSLAKFATDSNVDLVIDVARNMMPIDKMVSQLEQKACKVNPSVLVKALSDKIDLMEILIKKGPNGENLLNDTSTSACIFINWIIIRNGIEQVIQSLRFAFKLSPEAIVSFFVNAGLNEIFDRYLEFASFPTEYAYGMKKACATEDFETSHDMSIILRKYISLLQDND